MEGMREEYKQARLFQPERVEALETLFFGIACACTRCFTKAEGAAKELGIATMPSELMALGYIEGLRIMYGKGRSHGRTRNR